jgi:hypothetical protein
MATQHFLRRTAASAGVLVPPRLHSVSARRQLTLPTAFRGRVTRQWALPAAQPRAVQLTPVGALRPSRVTLQDARRLRPGGHGSGGGGGYAPPPPLPPRLLLLRGVRVVLWGTLVLIVAPGVVAYFTMREPVVFTGRDRAMLLSPEQEAELGCKMLAAIPLDKALPPDDPRVIAVSAIARRLAAAAATVPAVQPGITAPGAAVATTSRARAVPPATAPVDTTAWRVFVIDEPVRNAFAAPGGIVVIYAGMLEFIDGLARRGEVRDREGAVAAVLAHEIGHVLARHSAEKLSSMPLSFALRILLAPAFWLAIPLGIEWPYSRALEGEADLLGLEILRRACYAMDYAPEFYRASHSTPVRARAGAGRGTGGGLRRDVGVRFGDAAPRPVATRCPHHR